MTTKIFVIDDDSAVTDLLSVLLNTQGFNVWATNSSSEGLTQIREKSPDLVILDLMMPEMDGWVFCKAVCAFSIVPFIVISSLTNISMFAYVLISCTLCHLLYSLLT